MKYRILDSLVYKPSTLPAIWDKTSQTQNMTVLWQDTCRNLQRLCKFRFVKANNNVPKTTVQAIQSNRTQFNKWHTALLHVSTRKET